MMQKHISFQAKGKHLVLTTDYIVVGSGAGGTPAALELVKAGFSVTLVETGAWRDPEDYPKSMLGAMRNLVQGGKLFTSGSATWPVVQGAHVGGTTVMNSAIRLHTPPDIFEQWQQNFGIGENMADEVVSIQHELDQRLSVQPTPQESLGEQDKLIYQTTTDMGYSDSHYLQRYLHGCEGLNHCFRGCPVGLKRSMDTSFIEDFIEYEHAQVISCAKVSKVLLSDNTAQGVAGKFIHPNSHQQGGSFHITANHGVLIAASVTGSPMLLKKSGVKNNNLGHGFQAHPGSAVFGIYPEHMDINPMQGPTQGWGSLAFRASQGFKLETMTAPMDMFASHIAGAGHTLMQRLQKWRHIALIAQACRAEAVGKISSKFGLLRIQYSLGKKDMERFRLGIFEAANIHKAAGATSIMPGIQGLPDEMPISNIDDILTASLKPNAYQAVLSHLFGGCVMGTCAENSVCDTDGRVHNYTNLYVMDASVLPSNLGVNPQHTIMAIAIRNTRHLIQQAQRTSL